MPRRKRKTKSSTVRPVPAYDLQVLKKILNEDEPNVIWRRNQKSKIDFQRLGFTQEIAYSILRGLRNTDFCKQSILENSPHCPPADVYIKHVRLPCCGDLQLYIKFLIEDSSLLIMISFHPTGK